MSRENQTKRRYALDSVLAYARSHPMAGLPYEHLDGVAAAFPDRRELLLALQYDWSQLLWARIEKLSLRPRTRSLTESGELARSAWQHCAARHPVLRRLLDQHSAELGEHRVPLVV